MGWIQLFQLFLRIDLILSTPTFLQGCYESLCYKMVGKIEESNYSGNHKIEIECYFKINSNPLCLGYR